ncbi:hypothetical protein [Noviherbaspirillum pedocola]|uniref:Uncharacterized protein n=1 Tax=Noviherbaspirillum pedocola TaxID=2801341 RepID=A0A934SW93_9BURK|nr:hypothetical protein [Noviherbaspirillum pedocola]MBK4736563.1 hypothetical protein [Noviherbaspirillum pedocola]
MVELLATALDGQAATDSRRCTGMMQNRRHNYDSARAVPVALRALRPAQWTRGLPDADISNASRNRFCRVVPCNGQPSDPANAGPAITTYMARIPAK